MAPRRKAARIEAPATIEEATRLIAEYLELGAEIDRTRAGADDAIRQIEAARDLMIGPAEARLKELFLQLRTWWAVARPALTEGKRKSIELAGAQIGDRVGTPALRLPKGMKVEDAVKSIDELVGSFPRAAELLRVKRELEKPALLRMLARVTDPSPLRERIVGIGFTVHQAVEFFITRAGPVEPDPVIEPEPEGAAS